MILVCIRQSEDRMLYLRYVRKEAITLICLKKNHKHRIVFFVIRVRKICTLRSHIRKVKYNFTTSKQAVKYVHGENFRKEGFLGSLSALQKQPFVLFCRLGSQLP